MKKLFVLFAIAAFTLSLTACKPDDTPDPLTCDAGYEKIGDECVLIDQDPVITGANNTSVKVGDTFDPMAGVSATDPEDGDITADIEIEGTVNTDAQGSYTLIYSVTDSGGNEVTVTRIVGVSIGDAPVISGLTAVTLDVGDSFNPATGVTASDTEDGDLTADIIINSSALNLAAAGIYTIVYTVTDSAGNVTTENRTITVNALPECGPNQQLVGKICVDIEPTVITIMHGAVHELDPFHEAYSGTEQLERQQLQTAVEEQYNVIINYEQYPDEAGWGPNRVSAIIQSSVSGDHLSDIYWVVSDWIQQLVEADAIVPVTQYMNTIGTNINPVYYDVGGYQGDIYGFESFNVTISGGLYYNADLIDSLGVANPSQMYLDGNWTWSQFETWATTVQTQLSSLGPDYYALGGMLSYYAAAMVPLNGGSLINAETGRVSFAQNPALETYDFLTTLYEKGLFETAPQYDAGSPSWQTGKVAVHPGSLWFINASNRWGGIPFEIGFVPYPVADDFTGEYVSPVNGVALMTVASGMTPEREQLVFQVWNALQLWRTEQEAIDAFELSLLTKFDDEIYIQAYMDIYDKVYLDLINAIGISAYSENGWTANINGAIRDGDARTVVDSIRPIYEAALDDYLGN